MTTFDIKYIDPIYYLMNNYKLFIKNKTHKDIELLQN